MMAQDYFICFCLAMLKDYRPTKFHQLLADKLQSVYERVESGEQVKLMVEMPPRHGKTQLISKLFPAWILGKSLKTPIICASYGSTLAEHNSQECREIVDSDVYKWIFPNTRLHQDSTSKEYWRTSSGGSYRAAGVGSSLTGLGGKYLVCDDPFKDRADADSGVIRENTWKWWQSVFMTRREGKATAVIVLNTRWHMDDLSGRLLEQDEVNGTHEWERFRFPAIAEEDEYIDGSLFRKAGDALWPEKFPVQHLLQSRKNMDVYEWSSLMQQSPILSENQEFRAEWFRYFEEKDVAQQRQDIYVLYDPAISQKKSADNSCITTLGKERTNPNIYRLEEFAARMDPSTAIEHIFQQYNKYGRREGVKFIVGIEAVAFQRSLITAIQEEMRRREVYFDIVEVKSTGSNKEDRIRGLIPLYKSGVVYHRKGVDAEYERELLQFPKGKHDDRIDAMSFYLQLAKPTKYSRGGAKRYVPKSTTYLQRR